MDEAAVDAPLEAEDNPPAPYGVSVAELDEMDNGDWNYWCGQHWVLGLVDVPAWLARLPGYIPTRATMAAN